MTRMSTLIATVAIGTGITLAASGASAQMHDHSQMHAQQGAAPAQDPAALSTGEIKKVDRNTGKLTIQHGPLANLGMPGMTMVFKASDPAMLDQVKEGDQIRFRAEQINGVFSVTKLELAR